MTVVKSNSARRREVRRSVPKPAFLWLQWLSRREIIWAILWALALALIGGFIAVKGQQPRYLPGQTLTKAIVPRLKFTATDEIRTAQERQRARDSEPGVYTPNKPFLNALKNELDHLILLAAESDLKSLPEETVKELSINDAVLHELRTFLVDKKPTLKWQEQTRTFIRNIFDLAILSHGEAEHEWGSNGAGTIVLIHPDPADPTTVELSRHRRVIYSIRDDRQKQLLNNIEHLAFDNFSKRLRPTMTAVAMANLKPTYLLDPEETEKRKQAAAERVDRNPVQTTYPIDKVLVNAGTQLDEATITLLKNEREQFKLHASTAQRYLPYLGQFSFIAIFAIALWTYIASYSHRVMQNPMRGLAITALLLLCQALAVGATQVQPNFIYATATFPTLLAAIVLAIAYDQRFALGIGAVLIICIIFSLNLPIGFVLVLFVGVGVAISQLQEVRNRSTLIRVGMWTGLAMAAAVWITAFIERPLAGNAAFISIALDSGIVLLTALAAGMFVHSALPTIEIVFKVTTAMTLKELNDASHPLLQRLAQAAPGTYAHSLRLAEMVESAAETIGANGLLCRVGAMFHDIGKLHKPQYFIENHAGPSRHAKLSPAMSVLIIVGHAKDGVEMAREYRLPRGIQHFIESHHGTTLVEYFYHTAKQQHNSKDKAQPSEFEFRYPGPKPKTKEAAILMLGDSMESACRSLDEPTPARLEQLVYTLARKRLMDGQFDECNISLSELHRIEESMTKTLCAVYHGRVKYPTEPATAVSHKKQPAPEHTAAATGS